MDNTIVINRNFHYKKFTAVNNSNIILRGICKKSILITVCKLYNNTFSISIGNKSGSIIYPLGDVFTECIEDSNPNEIVGTDKDIGIRFTFENCIIKKLYLEFEYRYLKLTNISNKTSFINIHSTKMKYLDTNKYSKVIVCGKYKNVNMLKNYHNFILDTSKLLAENIISNNFILLIPSSNVNVSCTYLILKNDINYDNISIDAYCARELNLTDINNIDNLKIELQLSYLSTFDLSFYYKIKNFSITIKKNCKDITLQYSNGDQILGSSNNEFIYKILFEASKNNNKFLDIITSNKDKLIYKRHYGNTNEYIKSKRMKYININENYIDDSFKFINRKVYLLIINKDELTTLFLKNCIIDTLVFITDSKINNINLSENKINNIIIIDKEVFDKCNTNDINYHDLRNILVIIAYNNKQNYRDINSINVRLYNNMIIGFNTLIFSKNIEKLILSNYCNYYSSKLHVIQSSDNIKYYIDNCNLKQLILTNFILDDINVSYVKNVVKFNSCSIQNLVHNNNIRFNRSCKFINIKKLSDSNQIDNNVINYNIDEFCKFY